MHEREKETLHYNCLQFSTFFVPSLSLSTQILACVMKVLLDWSVVVLSRKVVLRFATTESGEQSVIVTGGKLMLTLSAGKWAIMVQ